MCVCGMVGGKRAFGEIEAKGNGGGSAQPCVRAIRAPAPPLHPRYSTLRARACVCVFVFVCAGRWKCVGAASS